MITNLVASVTVFLATNTVETLPQKYIIGGGTPDCPTCAVATYTKIPIPDPKEKWQTTTIAEIHELTVDFDGYKCKNIYQNMLTNWTVHFVKSDDWKPSSNNVSIPAMWPMGGF